MEAALKAIAEPRRRAILRLVWTQERPAGEIAAAFPEITHAAVSQHLRVLKEADLVAERRDGRRRLYRARPEAVPGLKAFLERYWDEALARLKEHVERDIEERDARER
ncbi:MAG TPA: metalloregulator ArsR/SmtB family transcription factor [Actinomycetota bacterium]|jgi:DNA-binding transcriptional ArsR family regulator